MLVNKALKLLREVLTTYSQKEMAERLRISRSYISEIESGKKDVQMSLLAAYSKLLGMPVSSIVFLAEKLEFGYLKWEPDARVEVVVKASDCRDTNR